MPQAQTYTTFFEWLLVRKATSASEIRDWYQEYTDFQNQIDSEVKLNRIKAIFRSDTTPVTLISKNSNSVIHNGALSTQTYNLPAIVADSVGMVFDAISDDGSHDIVLDAGTDIFYINGIASGTTYTVTNERTIITAIASARWDVQAGVAQHTLGGSSHAADTLANLNTKISDGPIDVATANRITPWTRGWELPTAFTLSFDDPTRTLTVGLPTSPALGYMNVWQDGQVITKVAPEDIIIPDSEGWHIIYYDAGVLQQIYNPSRQQILNAIRLNPLVCYIYWDATNSKALKLLKESHLYQTNVSWHLSQHSTFGALFSRGMDPTDLVVNSTSPALVNAQFGLLEGVLVDEDIATTAESILSTVGLNIYTFEGTIADPYMRQNINAGLSMLNGTGGNEGRMYFQEDDGGGNWQSTLCDDNRYVPLHLFCDNNNDTTKSYFTVLGRSQHLAIADAVSAADLESQTIKNSDLMGPEVLRVASFIFRCRTAYAYPSMYSIPDNGDFIDYRYEKGGGGTTTTTTILNDNADVDTTSNEDDDALVWEALSALWKNNPYSRRRLKRTVVNTATYTMLATDYFLDCRYAGPMAITLLDAELAKDGRGVVISDRFRKSATVNNIKSYNESGDLVSDINASGAEDEVISDTVEWG